MQKEVSGTELLASRFARVEGFAPCFSRFLVSDDCILQVQEGPLDEATRRLLMVSKQMNELDLKRDERGNTLRDLAISGKAVLVWKLGAVSRRPFLKTVGRSFWERVPELVGESD